MLSAVSGRRSARAEPGPDLVGGQTDGAGNALGVEDGGHDEADSTDQILERDAVAGPAEDEVVEERPSSVRPRRAAHRPSPPPPS